MAADTRQTSLRALADPDMLLFGYGCEDSDYRLAKDAQRIDVLLGVALKLDSQVA